MKNIMIMLGAIVVIGCVSKKEKGPNITVEVPYATAINNAQAASDTNKKSSKCPAEMVEVEGNYCPEVEQKCLRWLDEDQSPTANGGIGPMRCAEFARPTVCLSKNTTHMHFCMSKFEYPGTDGSYPIVDVNYYQARKIAQDRGFRLCTKPEFNFACEGEEMHPYGYGDGFHRDAEICNIDKPWIDYNKFPRSSWNDRDAGLYQAVASDSNSKCKSVFGVYNLNGNVDEILDSEKNKNVVLSGGYFSVVRNRCRPSTNSHSKDFSFYQVGFRMCSDIK